MNNDKGNETNETNEKERGIVKSISVKEQIEKWVQGDSQCPNDHGACVPDFSCCNKNVNTPQELKDLFKAAYDDRDWESMYDLMEFFLQTAMKSIGTDKKVELQAIHRYY